MTSPTGFGDRQLTAVSRAIGAGASGDPPSVLVEALATDGTSAAVVSVARDALAILAAAGPLAGALSRLAPTPLIQRVLRDGVVATVWSESAGVVGDEVWIRPLIEAGAPAMLLATLPTAEPRLLVLAGPVGAGWAEAPPERLELLRELAGRVLDQPEANGLPEAEERALLLSIHQSGSPYEACRSAAEALHRMTDAEWVLVARSDPFGARFELCGSETGVVTDGDAPLLARVCRRLEPLEEALGPGADRLTQAMAQAGVSEHRTVPAEFVGERFGVLQIGFRRGGALRPTIRRRLHRVAFHLALALRQQSVRAAQEEALARLGEAQEQATEGARFSALAQMAGGVAHEFNNALGGILGRTQMLQRQTSDPQVLKGLATILEIGFRAAETVKQLQEFTRERDDEEYSPTPVADLWRALSESIRQRVARFSRESGSRFGVEFGAEVLAGMLLANAHDLEVAVGNVVTNALESTPGGGMIAVEAGCNERQLVIHVIDRGRGMSEEVRESCFDPFFSTKSQTGVGLGLSVTYGIIARHHGEIEIESELGAGTTVRMALPLVAEVQVPDGRSGRVLVIDDEEGICDVLRELFSGSGHEVDTCAGGRAAMEFLALHRYDLVCTDLKTADLSGWEVARAVKQTQPLTPVMLLTGFRDQLRPQEITESGIDAVLGKPFTLQQVLDVAERLLRGDGAAG